MERLDHSSDKRILQTPTYANITYNLSDLR